MKNCCVYIRVSTDQQASEGYSLDNQKRACLEFAKTRKYHSLRVFEDDGKSGRTVNRPAFQEMLKLAQEHKIEAVIIYKIDRFARNVGDFAKTKDELQERGIKMISVMEGDLSEGLGLTANIYACVAEWESRVNGQRTRDALMQKFREGWQPMRPPIGYRSVGGEKEKKTCEPDPYEGPIVVELFHLYATSNYSILEIQEWLSQKNIISSNGTGLGHSVICGILNNPFYYGLIRWHGESKTGNHKPLIDKALFDTCQYVLSKHRNFLTRRRIHNFLLRGFLYCFECGQRYTSEWHKAERFTLKGGKVAYYHCQKRDRNGCMAKYVEMSVIEGLVEKEFKKLEFSSEFIDAVIRKTRDVLQDSRENSASVKQSLNNQKTALETRRNRLEDTLLDGVIDRDVFKRKHNEIENQIRNIDDQLTEADNKNSIDIDLIEEVLSFTRNIYQTYIDAPPFLKRHYLRFFFEKLMVKNRRIYKVVPTPIFKILQNRHEIIIRKALLPREDSNLEP